MKFTPLMAHLSGLVLTVPATLPPPQFKFWTPKISPFCSRPSPLPRPPPSNPSMAAPRKPLLPSRRHNSSSSPSSLPTLDPPPSARNKENLAPVVCLTVCNGKKPVDVVAPTALKPSSLQICMSLGDPYSRSWEPLSASSSSDVWDQFSDSESAPASSWATLPNRYVSDLRFL